MNDGLEQDLWHVEASPGDVKVVTLDQLDEAFQQGLVNENTRVWQEGMPQAMTLAELLGGADDESAPESVVPEERVASEEGAAAAHELERYQPEPQPTLIGLSAADMALSPSAVPEMPASLRAEPEAHAAPPPMRAEAPAPRTSLYPPPNVATPPVSVAPSYPRVADTGSAWPPVVTRSAPPPAAPASIPPAPVLRRPQVSETAGAWPPVITKSAPPPSSSNSDSLRPVIAPSVPPPSLASSAMPMAFDLDDEPFARKSGKGKVIFGAITVLAAAAGVAFAVNGGAIALPSSSTEAPVVAAAPAPPPAPEPPKSHAFDPGSAPVHLNDAPAPVAITTRANEEANLAAAIGKKLGVTGKTAAPKTAVHATAKSSRRTGNTSGGGFKTHGKGSVYDPLNGSL